MTKPILKIPPFHFPHGKQSVKHDKHLIDIITKGKQAYNQRPYLTESQFVSVTKACGLPRFMNLALFRKLEALGKIDTLIPFPAFVEGWMSIAKYELVDEALFFNILKKTDRQWVSPEDFLPVLEDVVLNHPGLQFLGDNPMFQERYIETVICRIYYEGKCPTGRMLLSQFRKCQFTQMINNLGPDIDLNNTRDCFSYKHFYVLYCKFWVLDEDHDLIISEHDLCNYNDGIFSSKLTRQIIQHGRIPAFARDRIQEASSSNASPSNENTFTYIDYIWFLLSETDKSTPTAIEYWFQCIDSDGDGIITSFDLSEYWDEQDKKLQEVIELYGEDVIRFDDLICQLNDLIQPKVPGQFRLCDLKRNGMIAERFFDTFLNIEKFQIHDTYQGLIRANQILEKEKKRQYEFDKLKLQELQKTLRLAQEQHHEDEEEDNDEKQQTDKRQDNESESKEQQQYIQRQRNTFEPFTLGAWCDYAEKEYDLLILNEQCGSVDSDWSAQNNEFEEIELAVDPNDEPQEDSSSSDDHESDSSLPTTPVLPEAVDDQQWLGKTIQETVNETTRKMIAGDWMFS